MIYLNKITIEYYTLYEYDSKYQSVRNMQFFFM